jgi:hypothetical protein
VKPRQGWLFAGALAAVLLSPWGCASLTRPPRVGPELPSDGDREAQARYLEVLERNTAHREIYDLFDSRAFLAATLQTTAFREARAKRVAQFRALVAADAEALLAAERKAHEESLEVILGLHANEKRFDDLHRPNSIWTLALVTEAGEAVPLSVERLPRPDANMFTLYPYLSSFWSQYRIRFPRTLASGAPLLPMGAKKATLRLASSVGKAELAFALDSGATGAAWP